MKNLHLIPTNKPSRLWTNNLRRRLELDEFPEQHPTNIGPKHIYITNSEEIKEGDWFIREGSIHKCFKVHKTDIEFLTSIDSVYCGSNTFWSKEYCKKIILTTDQDLIKDGVQAIDDEFLGWFVKNPSCEEVKVADYGNVFFDDKVFHMYKIIIPQEEPKYIIQKVATHLGKTIPETLKHIENFSKELDKLKEEPKQETRKNRLLEELIEDIKNQQSFLKSIRKNPQLYYYKFGTCIYERLYNNNDCFEMQDPYGGQSSKMEKELIELKAKKIYYE
jgi:hypothetical protein